MKFLQFLPKVMSQFALQKLVCFYAHHTNIRNSHYDFYLCREPYCFILEAKEHTNFQMEFLIKITVPCRPDDSSWEACSLGVTIIFFAY